MASDNLPLPLRILRGAWNAFDGVCRVAINVFVAICLIALLTAMLSADGKPDVEDGVALVLSPAGTIVEELGSNPMDRALGQLTGQSEQETLLRDLVVAVREAKDDDRIAALYLDAGKVGGAYMTKLQDLRAAIHDFKESGKPVVAYADSYGRDSYYLASVADDVLLHPMGMAMIEGFSRYRNYYKDAIDKLEVNYHVFKVGTFKSAVEPYIRNDMSPAAKEANLEWMGDLWDAYRAEVSEGRGMSVEDFDAILDRMLEDVQTYEGDTAKIALESGLVDKITGRVEMRAHMKEIVGEDEDHKSFRQINHATYLAALGKTERESPKKAEIAVVVAKGEILDGTQPPGKIGGDSTSRLIRKAREDENVKAIVLRVDSGGGSAFASEVIRKECEKAQADGKKVIISMGSVAASGGYWISTSSDRIYAHPTTITGSIGIFGMFPTFEKTMEKVGLHTDGVGTTEMAGAFGPDRPLPDEIGEAVQKMVEQGYREFLQRVANARDMTPEDVDKIAQGRVWSGVDAHRLGLIDELGTLQDAIEGAAELAELDEDFDVRFVTREVSFRDKFLAGLFSAGAEAVGPSVQRQIPEIPQGRLLRKIADDARVLSEMNDPRGLYALSFIHYD